MADNKYACPFDECTERFGTDRSLRAHIRAHRSGTPLECGEPGCKSMFGTLSERNEHKRHAHPSKAKRRAVDNDVGEKITRQMGNDYSRFDDSMILNANQRKNKNKSKNTTTTMTTTTTTTSKSGTDTTEEDEDVHEIAENAAYLVSQLRDAWSRSDVLTNWNDSDVRNLHQWGVWVEDSVHDIVNNNNEQDNINDPTSSAHYAKLKRALQKRGVNIQGLFKAEQAVMYALLGDSNLSDERLSWIVGSIADMTSDTRLNAFVQVAAQCIQRKRRNLLFDTLSHKLSISDMDVQLVSLQAKAYLLAKRIIDGRSMPPAKLSSRNKTDDLGWNSIIIWTAYFILHLSDSDHPSPPSPSPSMRSLWTNVKQSIATPAIWHVPHDVITRLCQFDFVVMDQYLSSLLRAIQEGADRTAEASKRIIALTECDGRVGWLTKHVVRKFTSLTGINGLLQVY